MQYAAGHDKALCGRRSVRDANCVALREHERRFRELLPVEDTDTSGPVAMSLEQCADHSGRYDTRGAFEALLEGVAGVQAAVGRAERFEIHAINSPWAANEICAAEAQWFFTRIIRKGLLTPKRNKRTPNTRSRCGDPHDAHRCSRDHRRLAQRPQVRIRPVVDMITTEVEVCRVGAESVGEGAVSTLIDWLTSRPRPAAG